MKKNCSMRKKFDLYTSTYTQLHSHTHRKKHAHKGTKAHALNIHAHISIKSSDKLGYVCVYFFCMKEPLKI